MPITKRTKPLFRLTHSTEINVKRPGENSTVKGRKVVGVPTAHTIVGNVQPLKPSEVVLMNDADRTMEWIRVYSDLDQDIRTAKEGDDGWEADIVLWNGLEYRVMKQEAYRMGVLDHLKTYAARNPTSFGL